MAKKPDWSRWAACPWCMAKRGEPCVVTSSRYPWRNGQLLRQDAPVHYVRRFYTNVYLKATG